jgi:hypothetical protein
MKRYPFILITLFIVAAACGYFAWRRDANQIKEIVLTSPTNTAMYNQVEVRLAKAAPVYIDYTDKSDGRRYRTRTSAADTLHRLDLVLLRADTEYDYQVVIDGMIPQKSKKLTFKTRQQSPWLVNHWLTEKHPHDAAALGDDGMILVCFGRLPGYMALIDNRGEVRWYWQIDDIGVRAASITPRGTILAMLRPFVKDVIDDEPMSADALAKEEHKKPLRRGALGFAGGKGLAEVSLTGETMWRLDLDSITGDNDYHVIHHDILMDADHHIHTLYRPKKVIERNVNGRTVSDTLGGDGIMVIDTLGNVLRTWSAWQVWDTDNDPDLDEFKYDRFHMNALCFDTDSNYLVSNPIADQIWKINRQDGSLMWRFGRNGDFEMDSTACFSFQHTPYIDPNGDLMLFDNGLYAKRSGAKAFRLDEAKRTAVLTVDAPLPPDRFTTRMGSAYLMPNGNLLQTSSKTGAVMVTDREGNVLWESIMYYAPYRALYVNTSLFKEYFTEIK